MYFVPYSIILELTHFDIFHMLTSVPVWIDPIKWFLDQYLSLKFAILAKDPEHP